MRLRLRHGLPVDPTAVLLQRGQPVDQPEVLRDGV